MHLALSLLCENPHKQTGLTTLFRELVVRSLQQDPSLKWTVFTGRGHHFAPPQDRLNLIEDFPANDQPNQRIFTDQFLVGPTAKKMRADALVTIGFVPKFAPLPTMMHLLTLHHLSKENGLSPLKQFYRSHVAKHGIKKCKLLITNSQFAADQIRQSTPFNESKLLVSSEGIDHAIFHPHPHPNEAEQLKKALGVDPGYLLWLSNLYPYKQAPRLIEAYAQLPATLRHAHPLVFVGGNWNQQREAALQQAEKLGVRDHLNFLGWVDEKWIAPLYRQAAAHVLASREETWGRSVSEAMACGTPSVVNDIPVMHEVTGGHAILVNFQDTQAACQALHEVLTNTSKREMLIQNGFERAKQLDFDRLARERVERIRAELSAR